MVKEAPGVQRGILNVFIRAAVKSVGPAFRDYVNGGEAIAILSGCVARIDAHLGRGILRHVVVAAVVISGSGGSRPVNQEVYVVTLRAVDSHLLADGLTCSSAVIHAGNQLRQLAAPVGTDNRRRV